MESEAPGWDAISAALRVIYGEQEPRHWAPVIPAMLGGQDPLQGISAYRVDSPPHWHFITYGFSDLYEKSRADSPLSGYGFELTLRLQHDLAEEPPAWCLSFLQNLGRYVFSTGNVFEPGHYMNLNGPIQLGSETALWAAYFIDDPLLRQMSTPNGELRLLQVVGLTLQEVQTIRRWDSSKFTRLLLEHQPLGITDLGRPSLLDIPAVAKACAEGIAAEGSSTGELFLGTLAWRVQKRLLRSTETVLTLGANGVRDLGPVLLGRLPFGRPLAIFGGSQFVTFEPGERYAATVEKDGDREFLVLQIPPSSAARLAELLRPVAGTYSDPSFPGLQIVIERSYIKNADGEIVETVG